MNRFAATFLLVIGCTMPGRQNATPLRHAAGQIVGETAASHAREQSYLQSPPADGPPADPNDKWTTPTAAAWQGYSR